MKALFSPLDIQAGKLVKHEPLEGIEDAPEQQISPILQKLPEREILDAFNERIIIPYFDLNQPYNTAFINIKSHKNGALRGYSSYFPVFSGNEYFGKSSAGSSKVNSSVMPILSPKMSLDQMIDGIHAAASLRLNAAAPFSNSGSMSTPSFLYPSGDSKAHLESTHNMVATPQVPLPSSVLILGCGLVLLVITTTGKRKRVSF
jgi:hypothetical protein